MLTIEMLRQNTQLAGLTDDQLKAIAEMSQNDENTVIGTKIGALHGQYDNDILSITGVTKNSGEKSYDYLKRVLNANKDDLATLNTVKTQLSEAQAKVTKLEKQISNSATDEALKQQLKDARTQVTQLQNQLNAKQQEFNTEKTKLQTQLQDVQINYAFEAAVSGIKFKAGITEGVQKTLLNAAKAEVLQRGTPEFQQNADGTTTLVFRNVDGNILNNPKNNLNPYTFKELLMETSVKDVIDTGRHQTGGGTGSGSGSGSGSGDVLDFSNAKTQVEADKVIENYLLGNGLTRDSAEFAVQSMQLRAENKVDQLPIR